MLFGTPLFHVVKLWNQKNGHTTGISGRAGSGGAGARGGQGRTGQPRVCSRKTQLFRIVSAPRATLPNGSSEARI